MATLQECLIDYYCKNLDTPKVANDLLKALEMLFLAGANKDIKILNITSEGGLLHSLILQPLREENDRVFMTECASMNKMIKFLHAQGFDFNAKDNSENTPLHIAANLRLNALVFETLVACGGGLNIAQ